MKTRLLFQRATALALLTAAFLCHADTKPIPLKEGQVLCKRQLMIPLDGPDATDEQSAILLKAVKDIARDYQCKVHIVNAPYARMERMYLDGKADVLVNDIQAPEFDAVGTFVPLYRAPLGFIMLRQPGMPTTAEQVVADRKLRVHYLRSTTPSSFSGWGKDADQFLAPLAKDNRMGSYKDKNEGIKKLRAHHIDAMFDDPSEILDIRAFDKALDPVYIPTNLKYVGGWYVSTKSAPGIDRDLLARLIYKYVRASGFLEADKRITDPKLRATWVESTAK